jgi:hypothetical protein
MANEKDTLIAEGASITVSTSPESITLPTSQEQITISASQESITVSASQESITVSASQEQMTDNFLLESGASCPQGQLEADNPLYGEQVILCPESPFTICRTKFTNPPFCEQVVLNPNNQFSITNTGIPSLKSVIGEYNEFDVSYSLFNGQVVQIFGCPFTITKLGEDGLPMNIVSAADSESARISQ